MFSIICSQSIIAVARLVAVSSKLPFSFVSLSYPSPVKTNNLPSELLGCKDTSKVHVFKLFTLRYDFFSFCVVNYYTILLMQIFVLASPLWGLKTANLVN